jgi:predicted RND superfamily exporter protein
METKKSSSAFQKLATFIVDKRNLFFLLYVFAIIFSLFSMNWVQVENDVTKYLPEDTETRLGIVAMNENFAEFGTARVMINNVSYETAQALADKIAAITEISWRI